MTKPSNEPRIGGLLRNGLDGQQMVPKGFIAASKNQPKVCESLFTRSYHYTLSLASYNRYLYIFKVSAKTSDNTVVLE